MFSLPPRNVPAGILRSAVITFQQLQSLPALLSTHLHRSLYSLRQVNYKKNIKNVKGNLTEIKYSGPAARL